MVKFNNYEVTYYKRGIGMHEPRQTVIDADTKQHAYDDFKSLYPNTCTTGIKKVKVIELPYGEDIEFVKMERGICEAERSYIE